MPPFHLRKVFYRLTRSSFMVSVPCSSLSTVVTVICGHCTSLLSVNMKKFSFLPFNLLTSLSNEDELKEQLRSDVNAPKGLEMKNSYNVISSDNDQDHDHIINQVNRVINKPPEKRRRGPSAYNRFIREEIRRLKTENPRIAHKEAFSTAAKNFNPNRSCFTLFSGPIYPMFTAKMMERAVAWKRRTAHGPVMQLIRYVNHELVNTLYMLIDGCMAFCFEKFQVNVESKGLHERKFPRHSMWAKTPFE
ncbi:hypothetical protein DKX38_013374 [Salix brachista]|uniref:HMG box domain-containing protein n=1 Tax=Salix brachista TaxID=2182728 RepID=A0A5N5LRR5_9ROSI|nr:hypothetical protein DKX38_013374 [Salix brachista]